MGSLAPPPPQVGVVVARPALGNTLTTPELGNCLETRIWGSETLSCVRVFSTSSGPLGRGFKVDDPRTTLTLTLDQASCA